MKPNIFSISPNACFLDTLVAGIIDGPLLGDWKKTGPFWLADVTIILPTRRSRLALSSAFASAMGGAALLPDIRTLGIDDGEESAFFISEFEEEELPTIPEFDRRFLLCTLVEKFLQAQASKAKITQASDSLDKTDADKIDGAKILGLADALAQLIDEIIIENINPDAIRSVPDLGLGPDKHLELSKNFEQNLQFLEIALSQWPKILTELGKMDASAKKISRVAKQAKNLEQLFGDRPVIAAGSTGSVLATANLLQAITKLKRGCLVLPGLDSNMDITTQESLIDPTNSAHGHPQYGMSQLLRRLGVSPSMVLELDPDGDKSTKTRLVRGALTLAKDTASWVKLREGFSDVQISKVVKNIALIAAKTEQEQALAIAIASRYALANNQSVGIITPDRNFARRVTQELHRFDIKVDDSAGTPLFHSTAGRLLRQILSLAQSNFAPVDLMALLKNANCFLGYERAQIVATVDLLEFSLLRGQRAMAGIGGLQNILQQSLAGKLPYASHIPSKKEGEQILALLKNIEQVFSPLTSLLQSPKINSRLLVANLIATLEGIIKSPLDASPKLLGLKEMQLWAQKLATSSVASPSITPAFATTILQALMANVSVRKTTSAQNVEPDIATISIWGRLEARLQSADLMIICTLNEGIWPQIADPGPWLSRSMRINAGMEPPERMHGLAAHDFEMAMGNPNIILAFANRIGTNPALPSRLLERFLAFAGDEAANKMRANGNKWLQIAHNIDKTAAPKPATRPAPCPPAKLRPKNISITEVETLIRSPYDLYAKYILGLKSIDPLGEELGNRERGNLIHEVFATFVEKQHDVNDEMAPKILEDIARQVFSVLDDQPDQRDIWLKRLQHASQGFLEFERSRDADIKTRFAETRLSWSTPADAIELKIHGKADRIDVRHDGRLEILDFKTGSIPSTTDMKDFMAPQLLMEAAIAKSCGFEGHEPASSSAINYIKISSGPQSFTLKPFATNAGEDVNSAAQKMLNMVQARAEAFLCSDTSIMSPHIMPVANQRFASRYDHLSRAEEWMQVDDNQKDKGGQE